MQKATVSREYKWWCAHSAPLDASYNEYILDRQWDIVKEAQYRGMAGYEMKDSDGVVHPFVPADFVTILVMNGG
jgi:hypothetical protein